jgi:short-subunit dehydrogenase
VGGTAIVTGASSGIGRAFARELSRRGHRVVVTARREERLCELAEELGDTVEVLVADLSTDAGLAAVERRVAEEPDLELLVNNAGFADLCPLAELDPEKAEESVRVLVLAPVRLTRAALPPMIARGGGAVVQVSSRAAFGARPRLALYAGAKAYLNRFSLAVARELEGSGVRSLVVCPGNVETELHLRAGIPREALPPGMSAEELARQTLAALERGEDLFVPGEPARDRLVRRLLPRPLARKLAGILGRLAGI